MTSVAPVAPHAAGFNSSSSSSSGSYAPSSSGAASSGTTGAAAAAAAAHVAAQQAAAANLTAVLQAHLTQSSAHPALTTPVQAFTRFSWTAGGAPGMTGLPVSMLASQPSAHGHAHGAGGVAAAAAVRAPGMRVMFQWPVASLAREWNRWQALLNGTSSADAAAVAPATLDPPAPSAVAAPSHGMAAPAAPGSAAAAVAASSAASAALPALPAPALSTGHRWSVVIDNCFFLPRAGSGTPAASAAPPGQRDKESKLYRVRMNHQSGAHASSWLVTHNLVVEGSAALDRWLESAAGGGSHSGSDSSPVQLRSSYVLQGEEWLMGDFIIRLATCKAGHKHHNALVMEIEHTACTQPSLDNCRPLYELAASLGVPVSAAGLRAVQDNVWPKFTELGLTPTHYTSAHSALQYIFLTFNLKENAMHNVNPPAAHA